MIDIEIGRRGELHGLKLCKKLILITILSYTINNWAEDRRSQC